MKLEDLEVLHEAKMVFARTGKKITKKFRCGSGPSKGRVVATASQCSAPIDRKKRQTLKKTKARMGTRLARKAKRTKRLNPISKRVRRLNK